MSPTPAQLEAARLLASWESALVQNMGPRLSAEESGALWGAILAHREHRDTAQLCDDIAKAIPARADRATALRAVRDLEALTDHPTAPSAQE